MDNEKLEYLRKNTTLSPLNMARLILLKNRGVSKEEIDAFEYECRFKSYEKSWDKTWEKLSWGEKEDESLREFAISALNEAVEDSKGKSK